MVCDERIEERVNVEKPQRREECAGKKQQRDQRTAPRSAERSQRRDRSYHSEHWQPLPHRPCVWQRSWIDEDQRRGPAELSYVKPQTLARQNEPLGPRERECEAFRANELFF